MICDITEQSDTLLFLRALTCLLLTPPPPLT